MDQDVFAVSHVSKRNTLTIRTTTPASKLPEIIGTSYSKIMEYMSRLNVEPMEEPFVAYYNMDMENLDVEIGFVVLSMPEGHQDGDDDNNDNEDGIKFNIIPPGREISCMYKGPYAESAEAYDKLLEFAEQMGVEVTGTAYEYYYNSPAEVPESELLTKIVFPLKF